MTKLPFTLTFDTIKSSIESETGEVDESALAALVANALQTVGAFRIEIDGKAYDATVSAQSVIVRHNGKPV